MLMMTFILLVALIFNSSAAAEAARTALCNCAVLIVPSLFPFFVLSMLLNRLGLSARLSRLIHVKGISAFIMGIFGGYPLGAVTLADMFRRGELTRDEAEALLPCCNNTGPAFIIGAVGTGVFASLKVGLMLYAVHITSALAVWAMVGFKQASNENAAAEESFAFAFPSAVRESVTAVLNVCGFVVFFSVLLNLLRLDALCAHLGFGADYLRVFLTGLAELGSAVSEMKVLPSTPETVALASFILGFGGLSVHCQTAAAAEGTGLDLSLHFFGRVLAGSIGAALSYIISIVII